MVVGINPNIRIYAYNTEYIEKVENKDNPEIDPSIELPYNATTYVFLVKEGEEKAYILGNPTSQDNTYTKHIYKGEITISCEVDNPKIYILSDEHNVKLDSINMPSVHVANVDLAIELKGDNTNVSIDSNIVDCVYSKIEDCIDNNDDADKKTITITGSGTLESNTGDPEYSAPINVEQKVIINGGTIKIQRENGSKAPPFLLMQKVVL